MFQSELLPKLFRRISPSKKTISDDLPVLGSVPNIILKAAILFCWLPPGGTLSGVAAGACHSVAWEPKGVKEDPKI